MCSYYQDQDGYHLVCVGHNSYFSTKILGTDYLQIYFVTRFSSIGAILIEELRGKFDFDKWDVHVKGSIKYFAFFLLNSSKAKRVGPTWLHFLRHLPLDSEGQVKAAAVISSYSPINFAVTFVFH